MARARAGTTPSQTPSHLRRSPAWSGLCEGDPVDVLDPREAASNWRFVAHVTNTKTGEEWVEVVGGRKGDERRRSFRPDQLYPHRSVRGGAPTAASLTEAPRLSFGGADG